MPINPVSLADLPAGKEAGATSSDDAPMIPERTRGFIDFQQKLDTWGKNMLGPFPQHPNVAGMDANRRAYVENAYRAKVGEYKDKERGIHAEINQQLRSYGQAQTAAAAERRQARGQQAIENRQSAAEQAKEDRASLAVPPRSPEEVKDARTKADSVVQADMPDLAKRFPATADQTALYNMADTGAQYTRNQDVSTIAGYIKKIVTQQVPANVVLIPASKNRVEGQLYRVQLRNNPDAPEEVTDTFILPLEEVKRMNRLATGHAARAAETAKIASERAARAKASAEANKSDADAYGRDTFNSGMPMP